MTWFRKSADQGETDAQRDIGLIYQKGGYGVSLDYAEALRWYRTAAEQGHAGAQQNIGRLYFEGWGVPKDQNQARRWWEMAAAGGNEEAKAALMTYFGQAK
jgi:TPR repeat protein